MNFIPCRTSRQNLLYLLCYALASVILFSPVLHKSFVSDDFVVLKRVCLENQFWVAGFFRPLSDLTIDLNYNIGGFDPFGFNLFNILIHALNSFLLLQFCLKWKWSQDAHLQQRFSFMASILFLVYPFHNEAIVWLLGRGASLAGSFFISALLIFLSKWKEGIKLFVVAGCYFVGLTAYESIIILPLLILILLFEKQASTRSYLRWIGAFSVAGMINLLLRYKFSGALMGAYGEKILTIPVVNVWGNIFKVIARLLIPPIQDSGAFLITAISVVVVVSVTWILLLKRKGLPGSKRLGIVLSVMTGCTLIVAVIVAVSTRTSEGDRLLYIPSFFVCCLISYLLCRLVPSEAIMRLVFILLCAYNIFFLELNNYNWRTAGTAVQSILGILSADTGKIYIANLPNEIKGAYIFREGFKDALIINQIDTSNVVVINKLSKELNTSKGKTWKPLDLDAGSTIPPFLKLSRRGEDGSILMKIEGKSMSLPANSRLYYWNQHKLALWAKPGDLEGQ